MDIKLVILGMVFVVVLIMMGDNPFEVPEEYKRDPFRYRLEKKLAEQEKTTTLDLDDPSRRSIFGMQPPAGTSQPGANGVPAPGSNPAAMNQDSVLVPGPGGTGYVVQQKPGTFANWQQFQQTIEQAQAAQKQGASPQAIPQGQVVAPTGALTQPAIPAQAVPGQGAQPPPRQADGAPAFFLKDGRRVFFSGYKVFVLIADGQIKVLEDGDHPLSSGETLVIRGGKRRAVR